ncbi:MAG TPA: recombinase family protein [Solirubrobacteraceae bacterium]|nr:recombinase family protein [Solirubrobacteraceae bacterium]
MKKAAVYLRVSTKKQDEENQEPSCLEVCRLRGWQPVIYRERESGVKFRPEWDRLLADARVGRVEAVVFFSIMRLGRKRVQIAGDLAELARYGMALVSVRERFLDVDGSPELARLRPLLVQWWGWFAEAERDEIVARTRVALDRIRGNLEARGHHTSSKSGRTITTLGRPRKYDDKTRRRVRELVEVARALKVAPKVAEIARQLQAEGLPKVSRQTIRDWMITATEGSKDASAG